MSAKQNTALQHEHDEELRSEEYAGSSEGLDGAAEDEVAGEPRRARRAPPKMALGDSIGLYAKCSATIFSRISGKLVSGFQSLFSIDESTRQDYFLQKGLGHVKARRYDKAVPLLEPLHEADPQNTEVAFYLGLAYLKTGCEAEGVELLEQVHAAKPEDTRIDSILGIAYMQIQDYKKAIKHLKTAAKNNPDSYKLRYRLGVAYDNLKDYDKAIEWFVQALELRPNDTKLLRSIGFAYEVKGDHEAAVSYLKRANELEELQ